MDHPIGETINYGSNYFWLRSLLPNLRNLGALLFFHSILHFKSIPFSRNNETADEEEENLFPWNISQFYNLLVFLFTCDVSVLIKLATHHYPNSIVNPNHHSSLRMKTLSRCIPPTQPFFPAVTTVNTPSIFKSRRKKGKKYHHNDLPPPLRQPPSSPYWRDDWHWRSESETECMKWLFVEFDLYRLALKAKLLMLPSIGNIFISIFLTAVRDWLSFSLIFVVRAGWGCLIFIELNHHITSPSHRLIWKPWWLMVFPQATFQSTPL